MTREFDEEIHTFGNLNTSLLMVFKPQLRIANILGVEHPQQRVMGVWEEDEECDKEKARIAKPH